jgi:hypothetical protein
VLDVEAVEHVHKAVGEDERCDLGFEIVKSV